MRQKLHSCLRFRWLTKNRQNTVFFAEDFERGLPHPVVEKDDWKHRINYHRDIGHIPFWCQKIPELARNLGRAKGEFHAGVSDVTSPSRAEIDMDRGGVSDDVANENE